MHIGIGLIASVFRASMQLYFLIALGYFLYQIVTKPNKQQQVLIAAAYITAAEVYLRMTKALFFYESGKYLVIAFITIGMFYQGYKRNAFPYIIYFLLLIPGVFVSYLNLNFDSEFRKMILFNLSGPICLAFAAIYCHGRTITLKNLLQLLDYMVYPLISMTVYIYLYNPDIAEVIISTVSTSETTGGYGPNQVATMLGFGTFILFVRLLIPYQNKIVHFTMMFFLVAMAYRALITFSRGGVVAAIIMCIAFSFILYFSTSLKTKFKLSYKLIAVVGAVFAIWLYALLQTGGLIENRYTNKDALGRDKEDVSTGRIQLIEADFQAFMEDPIFGIGVGKVKSFYIERLNIELPSHNEVARMLSEHGSLGIIALLILFFTPLSSKFQGRKNIFFYPFILFWLITILHSSMRIAAPAFVYGLALLNIQYVSRKKDSLYRKPAIQE
ncbi:MAG: O-antigen ligase family protein [Bacteroidetes bacterium]|nr:O-antigen ligase family protein [Bacteroidota bacterium]